MNKKSIITTCSSCAHESENSEGKIFCSSFKQKIEIVHPGCYERKKLEEKGHKAFYHHTPPCTQFTLLERVRKIFEKSIGQKWTGASSEVEFK